MKNFYKIGHRGAMDLEPENTLRSINRAIDLGVDAIEIDVYRTKDKELVVLHYEGLEKTTNGKGLVWEHTLSDIKKLDAGKGERVPTLQEVLDTVNGRCDIMVEIKMYGIEKLVMDIINRNKGKNNIMLISFFHDIMKEIKATQPTLKTGVTFMAVPVNVTQLAIDANADAILPQYQFLTSTMVEAAHSKNIKVYAWHTEDIKEIRDLIELGVDGIMTNNPELFSKIF